MKNKIKNKNKPSLIFAILIWISKQEELVVRAIQRL